MKVWVDDHSFETTLDENVDGEKESRSHQQSVKKLLTLAQSFLSLVFNEFRSKTYFPLISLLGIR